MKESEKARERRLRYNRLHKDEVREYHKRYAKEHRDDIIKNRRKYYSKHKEEIQKRVCAFRLLMAKTHPLYSIHKAMLNRCSENNNTISWYKIKNIRVCDEWKKLEVFEDWAKKNGWKKGLQIDRIDNSKGYSPENCRFVTRKVNMNNRDATARVEIKGVKICLSDLMDGLHISLSRQTVYTRIFRYKWDVLRALLTPNPRAKTDYEGEEEIMKRINCVISKNR